MHNDFDNVKSGIDSVTILFPHIEYVERGENACLIKRGHSIFVAKSIADIVNQIIEDGQFIPHHSSMQLDSMVTSQWIPKHLFNSSKNFRNIDNVLAMIDPGQKIFPVSGELELLLEKAPTRYILFINGFAFGTTQEAMHIDILNVQTFELLYDHPFAYDYSWQGLALHIYLFDKRSAEIVWYSFNEGPDKIYDPLKQADLKELMQKLLVSKE